MTQEESYYRLVTRLADLHDAAVTATDTTSEVARESWRQRFGRALTDPSTRPSGGAAVIDPPQRNALFTRRLAVTVAVPALAIAAVAIALRWQPSSRIDIRPEPIVLPPSAAIAVPPPRPRTNPVDPCAHRPRAEGGHPLIDDFEDANPLIASEEGRVALWAMYQDTEAPGTNSSISPTLRPQPTRTNRYALHAKGGELRNWGAAIQLAFTPSCYDASAYGGIVFSAKGPGRLYVGAREIRVVPVEYGGTCTKDCYNTHQKKVDLSPYWRTYSVKWVDMQQRGYDTPPLDPSKLNGLSFLIQPGDTPYDLWVDDVKFIKEH